MLACGATGTMGPEQTLNPYPGLSALTARVTLVGEAEAAGFEPAKVSLTRFQGERIRPLCHASKWGRR